MWLFGVLVLAYLFLMTVLGQKILVKLISNSTYLVLLSPFLIAVFGLFYWIGGAQAVIKFLGIGLGISVVSGLRRAFRKKEVNFINESAMDVIRLQSGEEWSLFQLLRTDHLLLLKEQSYPSTMYRTSEYRIAGVKIYTRVIDMTILEGYPDSKPVCMIENNQVVDEFRKAEHLRSLVDWSELHYSDLRYFILSRNPEIFPPAAFRAHLKAEVDRLNSDAKLNDSFGKRLKDQELESIQKYLAA